MRSVPSNIAGKLSNKKQTKANSADPSASIWIGRPTTPLTDDTFLERQTVLTTVSVTDSAVAVCHPRRGGDNTKIHIAYVDGGVAKVVYAAAKAKTSAHVWVNTDFAEPASAVSIAYDGTMPKGTLGRVEFVTEDQPWVFWVNVGAMYCRKLGTSQTITLAEQNCTDVSAIRAMWSEVGSFDFGLVVFFLLTGTLYYRQLLDGEWKDAEVVSSGPAGVTWTEIAAFRTWDYRVGVQAKTSTGDIYELFTQFMGIGKQNVEHINVADISAESETTEITYHNTKETENVEVSDISSVAPYGGLYSVDTPVSVDAYNIPTEIEVEGEIVEDWGRAAIIRFNVHLVASDVASNSSRFALKDSNNVSFSATSATLDADGKTVTLTFTDFNAAAGECQIGYTPGTAYSMASVAIPSTSFSFTPINLNAPDEPAPEVEAIWNE